MTNTDSRIADPNQSDSEIHLYGAFTIREQWRTVGIDRQLCGFKVYDAIGEFVCHYSSFTMATRAIDAGLCD